MLREGQESMVGGRAPSCPLMEAPLKWQMRACSWRSGQEVTWRKILGGKMARTGKILVSSFFFCFNWRQLENIMHDAGRFLIANSVSSVM